MPTVVVVFARNGSRSRGDDEEMSVAEERGSDAFAPISCLTARQSMSRETFVRTSSSWCVLGCQIVAFCMVPLCSGTNVSRTGCPSGCVVYFWAAQPASCFSSFMIAPGTGFFRRCSAAQSCRPRERAQQCAAEPYSIKVVQATDSKRVGTALSMPRRERQVTRMSGFVMVPSFEPPDQLRPSRRLLETDTCYRAAALIRLSTADILSSCLVDELDVVPILPARRASCRAAGDAGRNGLLRVAVG